MPDEYAILFPGATALQALAPAMAHFRARAAVPYVEETATTIVEDGGALTVTVSVRLTDGRKP